MTEEKILDHALEILDQSGVGEAYRYLTDYRPHKAISSQYYNFLYCLSALDGNKEEALSYLEEAIFDKKMWYRPAVFDDEDLDSIREDDRFKACLAKSEKRYRQALDHTKTVFTWEGRTGDHLVIALHGNQQNNADSKKAWDFLLGYGYQVDYLQSKELDSYGVFRWDEEGSGPNQLMCALEQARAQEYEALHLCGFSAGCNTILKAITSYNLVCTSLILQSPWIPMINKELDQVVDMIVKRHIKVILICGTSDDDCYPLSKSLYHALLNKGGNVVKHWVDGLGHGFSLDYQTTVIEFFRSGIGD